MKVVNYVCSGCGTQTDSSRDLHGWAFGKKDRFCPACFVSKDRAPTPNPHAQAGQSAVLQAEYVGPVSILEDRPCSLCGVLVKEHTAEQAKACVERWFA